MITGASGVIGLELFGNIGGDDHLEGILLTDKTASTIYYPHVDNNGWWTGIVAYNPSASECTITITPYSAQGTALTPSNQSIPGKGKYVGLVSELNLPPATAWFKIDSPQPLSGFELFSTLDENQLAAYAGGSGPAKTGVFPKIEKAGGWTGIAFVNTEVSAASVTLTAYNDNGTVVATQVLPVGGHAKVVNYAESIFSQNISGATYIAYSSDRNVVGFQLNGSSDGTMLDGLPGLTGGGAVPLTTTAGTPNGVPVSATIGPAGGTLSSADGRLQITFPAGAVAANTQFTITPLTNPADNALATYRLEPEGATFAKPVRLTFNAPEAGVSTTSIEGLGIAYHKADGQWQWLDGTSDSTNKTLSVETTHFSVYSLLAGYQLIPNHADVDVDHEVKLQILACVDPQIYDQPADAPASQRTHQNTVFRVDHQTVYECRPIFFKGATAIDWSVNSIIGGNDTVGTISAPFNFDATYRAPPKQPNPKTVNVSAQFMMDGYANKIPEKVLLVSSITINKQPDYSGSFVSTINQFGLQWTATGDVKWTMVSSDSNGPIYEVDGTVSPDQTVFQDGDWSCVLSSPATQSWQTSGMIFSGQNPFPGQTLPGIAWGVQAFWDGTCTDKHGQTETRPNFLFILWAAVCSNGVGNNDSYAQLDPSLFPDTLHGTFKCGAGFCNNPDYNVTVTWTFYKREDL